VFSWVSMGLPPLTPAGSKNRRTLVSSALRASGGSSRGRRDKRLAGTGRWRGGGPCTPVGPLTPQLLEGEEKSSQASLRTRGPCAVASTTGRPTSGVAVPQVVVSSKRTGWLCLVESEVDVVACPPGAYRLCAAESTPVCQPGEPHAHVETNAARARCRALAAISDRPRPARWRGRRHLRRPDRRGDARLSRA
jgi:hypothetical protein